MTGKGWEPYLPHEHGRHLLSLERRTAGAPGAQPDEKGGMEDKRGS